MSKTEITSVFGLTIAKPMGLVDIHDVQSLTDEESINNSSESKSDKTDPTEVAPKATPSPQEVSSINSETDTPTDKQ